MPALDEDDSKVMDVSKPGKGKPVGTSRPVVAPVVSEPAEDDSVSVSVPVSEPVEALRTSSGSHKTIEPLSADLQPEDKKKDDTTTESVPEDGDVSGSSDEADDAAGVDALASTTETKKEAAKKAEEQAKRDAELQALIASRKYVVPISGTSGGGSKARVWGIPLVLIAIIIAGGYLLADAGVFGDSVKVPFEIIKNSKAQTAVDTTAAASVEEEQDKLAGQEEQKKTEQESSEPAGNASVAPEVRARDSDRKNELKNLQQKLETYFNDNDEYPLSLSGLTPRPTAAELTDDRGANYSYTSNGQSYTLAAQLENTNDPDAESDGSYLLRSINE